MKRAGIFAGVLAEWERRRLAKLRERALAAVQAVTIKGFTLSDNGPGEGPLNERGYRHVIKHPSDYFICMWCGCGPWHHSWSSFSYRNEAIGGCCSGAD